MSALGNGAAACQAKAGGRQAGHAADGLFERKQADVTGIMSKHPREGAPQARMRMGIMRQAVGADHGALVAEDAPHVVFIHGKIHRTGRLQALSRLQQGQIPLRGDFSQVPFPAALLPLELHLVFH